jgi:hypothetical protein
MTDKKFSISLTAAIAELYEAQKHYFAAFAVYWFLYDSHKKEAYRQKMEEIKDKIYDTLEMRMNSIITKIFNKAEVQKLGILPESHYKMFQHAVADLQRDDKDGIGSIETGDDEDFVKVGKGISREWREIIADEPTRHKKEKRLLLPVEEEQWEQIRVGELLKYLDEYKEREGNLDEIKLSKLISNFLKNYQTEDSSEG